MSFRLSSSGFTIIELIVGMTIFSIGITGIYVLLGTTITTAGDSKNEIIASAILKEQIELVMNVRDTNTRNYIPWDSIYVEPPATQTTFSSGIYLIENNFDTAKIDIDPNSGTINKNTIKLTKIDNIPLTDELRWKKTQLRLDENGRYIHSENTGRPTLFGSYIIISPLIVNGAEIKKNNKNQGWIIDARVIIKGNGSYHEYDAKSMITDWIQ